MIRSYIVFSPTVSSFASGIIVVPYFMKGVGLHGWLPLVIVVLEHIMYLLLIFAFILLLVLE